MTTEDFMSHPDGMEGIIREIDRISKEQKKELDIECELYMKKCKYIVECLTLNKDLAITVSVNGVDLSLCTGTEELIELILSQSLEAAKCIEGEENDYQ